MNVINSLILGIGRVLLNIYNFHYSTPFTNVFVLIRVLLWKYSNITCVNL